MSLLPKQHGGGQAPALRADGMQGTGGGETHGGGQAPALRADGMQGTAVGKTSRSRCMDVSHVGETSRSRCIGFGTRMSRLPKQHGGGQAPALRADGNPFFS